ncbi:MAG: M23 family metallopeptidase [Candidatus Thiothrix sulfatifontis]|nr:MAG: M23 family metallopeptidase [Candidatus Thiothrix sulfatifontis]
MNKKPLLILLAFTIFMIGYWIPEDRHVPVANAKSYASDSMVYGYKVGGVNAQKGITIFADQGAAVEAVTSGLVLYREHTPQGDNSVWVLGAKWRLHHYANLDKVEVTPASWVKTGEKIGTVGTTKPAKPTKPVAANLYYSIRSLPPLVTEWKAEQPLGLDQVFYVNPHEFLTAYQNETKAEH